MLWQKNKTIEGENIKMDCIRIDNLEVFAHHGVLEEEKQNGQNFYVNAVLKTDLSKAGATDCLYDSTHYGEVCQQIEKSMTEQTYDLIERAAQKTAEDILLHFPLIQEVTLELRKPHAPIPMNFQSVSVQITRGWHKAYIAFGSNMGDKEAYIREALEALEHHPHFRNLRCSDFYHSIPYGGVEQDDFVNGALEIETLLSPYQLLDYLHTLEQNANRVRIQHWGPRTLDLDILFYDDLILDEADLQIPHKDMANRDFVLKPLVQIAPYKRHPISQKTVELMMMELTAHYLLKE